MFYVLILVLTLGGERHAFVVDYNLTAEDCAQAVRDNPGADLRCETQEDSETKAEDSL